MGRQHGFGCRNPSEYDATTDEIGVEHISHLQRQYRSQHEAFNKQLWTHLHEMVICEEDWDTWYAPQHITQAYPDQPPQMADNATYDQ